MCNDAKIVRRNAYFSPAVTGDYQMVRFTDRLSEADQIDAQFVLPGVALALGSLLVAGWALTHDDVTAAGLVVMYALVGALFVGIGTAESGRRGAS